MKRLLILLLIIPLLTGCTFMKAHVIRGNAKGFKGIAIPYKADLDAGDVVWYRVFLVTTDKMTKAFLENLPFNE